MDFFARREDYHSRSRRFYRVFSLTLVVAVAVFYLALSGCFLVVAAIIAPILYNTDAVSLLPKFIFGNPPSLFGWQPLLILTTTILAIILIASACKTRAIKKGGGAYIAEALGGEPLLAPRNEKEKRLLNVVEEMAVASGLPRPRVYIMPKERSLNAVTAGLNHADAVVAVTQGALDHLSRDELQGVVAHEFAHILNGDYALNLTMAGWLYGLLFFYVQGRDMMEFAGDMGNSNASEGDGLPILALIGLIAYFIGAVLCVGGWLGKAAAEIVQAAFSREREYLADTLAVQFTRNPGGLAGALKKIAGLTRAPGKTPDTARPIAKSEALLMKSFFIVSPSRADGLFSSHPPLAERILALDPAWDGQAVPVVLPPEPEESGPRALKVREKAGLEETSHKNRRMRQLLGGGLLDAGDGELGLPEDWSGVLLLGLLAAQGKASGSAEAATLMGRSLENANRLYGEMDPKVLAAAAEPAEVSLVIAAAFLEGGPDIRVPEGACVEAIRQLGGPEAEGQAVAFRARISDAQRLPLLALAAPTVKALPPEKRRLLGRAVKALVMADGRLDLFEVAARQVLKKYLGLQSAAPPPGIGDFAEQTRRDTVGVLSLLAHLGSPDPAVAGAAFVAGMAHFTLWPPYAITPRAEANVWELSRSLDRLSQAPDKIKTALVMAAVTIALHDRQINPKEYELLRALAAALDIPLPLLK